MSYKLGRPMFTSPIVKQNDYYFRLTEREKRDLDYKKKVLKLAKEHKTAGGVEKANRYYIPKEDEKPTDKYIEEEGPKGQLLYGRRGLKVSFIQENNRHYFPRLYTILAKDKI